MKSILIDIKNTILVTLILGVICCGAYPLIVYGMGSILFPHQANGSLITGKDGKILGSEIIGQTFTGEKYFHARPSAAGTGYDATSSGGTNLGPTSQKLMDSIKAAVAQYRKDNGLADDVLVPADAVTSSASGLDPHISPRNAELQVARVAKARNVGPAKTRELVEQYTDKAWLGIIGEPRVNVLRLNLALDGAATK